MSLFVPSCPFCLLPPDLRVPFRGSNVTPFSFLPPNYRSNPPRTRLTFPLRFFLRNRFRSFLPCLRSALFTIVCITLLFSPYEGLLQYPGPSLFLFLFLPLCCCCLALRSSASFPVTCILFEPEVRLNSINRLLIPVYTTLNRCA